MVLKFKLYGETEIPFILDNIAASRSMGGRLSRVVNTSVYHPNRIPYRNELLSLPFHFLLEFFF